MSITRSRSADLSPADARAPSDAWSEVTSVTSNGRPSGFPIGVRLALLLALAALASLLAWVLREIGDQPVIYDADNYVVHAKILLFEPIKVWGFRTYGYPLFLAPWLLVAGRDVDLLRWWVFLAQLVVHFGAAWIFAQRVGRAFSDRRLGRLTLLLVALNPFLLIMTGLLLSDLLSTALLAVAAALLLPTRADRLRAVIVDGMVGLAALTFAVEVRPANAILLPVGALLWMVRWWSIARPDVRRFIVGTAAVGLVAALPLLPQLGLNLYAHGVFSPLLVNSLYEQQLAWGAQNLKYATFVLREHPGYPAVFYLNPFGARQTDVAGFARSNPIGLAATLGLHAFAMLDQDFPFPYVREIDAWYRWPLASLSYLFCWAAAIGLVLGWRRWWHPGSRLAWSVLTVLSAAYVVVYLPTAVECRFGLPLFVLLSPAAAQAILMLVGWLRRHAWGPLTASIVSAVLVLVASGWLSVWMQAQSPVIVATREMLQSPDQFLPVARYDVPPPNQWTVEQKQTYTLRATNQGQRTWNSNSPAQVVLHVMFVGPGDAETVDTRVELRQPINRDVQPGDQVSMDVTLTAPRKEGDYRLRQQLELDGQPTLVGSAPFDTPVTVEVRRRR